MRRHESVSFQFGGEEPALRICGLSSLNIMAPSLFANLESPCSPIAVKLRRHSAADQESISSEVQRLQNEGIVEPSCFPWRAQVLVTAHTR